MPPPGMYDSSNFDARDYQAGNTGGQGMYATGSFDIPDWDMPRMGYEGGPVFDGGSSTGMPDFGQGSFDLGLGHSDGFNPATFGVDPGGFGGPDPFDPSGGGGSSGGGGWGNIFGQIGNALGFADGSTGIGNAANGLMIPSWMAAYNQWKDAGRYEDMGREAASRADPWGESGGRAMADQRLRSLINDPNAYLANSPDYQAALTQGLDAVGRSQASKGYMDSGNILAELQKTGSNLAAQYLDRDRQSLMQMAGTQFDPANAANMYMKGIDQSINSRNNALGSLMYPFLLAQSQQIAGNRPGTGTGGGTGTPGVPKPSGSGSSGSGSGGKLPNGLPVGINPMDPAVDEYIRGATGGDTPWNLWRDPNDQVDYDQWQNENAQDITNQLGGTWEENYGVPVDGFVPDPTGVVDYGSDFDPGAIDPSYWEGMDDFDWSQFNFG